MLFITSACILLILHSGCTNKTTNTSKNNEQLKTTHEVKTPELLYGKYPEPILKAIAENNDVQKDYKELTKEDLSKLKYLRFEIKHGFEDNKEYDFSILLDMPALTSLSIDFRNNTIKLKDYSFLKKLVNLKKLNISNVHDSDTDNLTSLTSLEWLSISNSDLSNIEFLDKIRQLKYFFLEYTPNIKNYEALKYLSRVEKVNLSYSNVTEEELKTVPDIDTLVGLGLVGNNFININEFPVFKNLTSLALCNNPLESIKIPLDNIPKLKYLDISSTLIVDANKIHGFDNIEEIIIKDTKIIKVAPFKKYKNLRHINATISNILDKSVLEGTNIGINEE